MTFEEYAAEIGLELLGYDEDDDLLSAVAFFYQFAAPNLELMQRNGQPIVIDVHVLNQPGLNALAASFDEADVIAINRDICRILKSTSRAIVSHGLLLEDERTEGLHVAPIFLPMTPDAISSGTTELTCPPLVDPRREQIAQQIYKLATLFIFEHELAHIRNGHIDWLGKENGLALVAELAAHGLPSPRGMEREALEWDADCSGIQACLVLALQPEVDQVDGRAVWRLIDNPYLGSTRRAVYILGSALMVCFALFASQDSSDMHDPQPRTHPHPLFRAVNAVNAISHTVHFRTGDPDVVKTAEMTEMISHFMQSWNATFINPASMHFEGGSEELVTAYLARRQRWADAWEKMHPELDAHKRGGILAPARPQKHPAFPEHDMTG